MKKVIDKPSISEIHVGECDHTKVYAIIWNGDAYKLQQMPDSDAWAFCCLGNSWTNIYGSLEGFQIALKEALAKGCEVFEFADYGEFIRWCYEQLS